MTEEELADKLHEHLCRWNHGDACNWYYAPDDWSEYNHKVYLAKAKAVFEVNLDPYVVVCALDIVKKV